MNDTNTSIDKDKIDNDNQSNLSNPSNNQSNQTNLEYRLANYRAKAEVMEKEILMNGSHIDGLMFWYITVNALFMYNSTILRAYIAYILQWILTIGILYLIWTGVDWMFNSYIHPFLHSLKGL